MHTEFHSDIAERERIATICQSLYAVISHAVPGDIVEFGIAQGYSWHALAGTIARCEAVSARFGQGGRRLHGFDSFQGLPEAQDARDATAPMVASGIWRAGACGSPGAEKVASVAEQFIPGRWKLYPGWFADTLPSIAGGQQFALVNLDCDLYASTAEVLEKLFTGNHLSDGCYLLFDDFLENRGSKTMGQRRAWEEAKERWQPDFTDLGFYARAGWRCIVHRT